MIQVARTTSPDDARLRFSTGFAAKLPYSSGSFDLVVSITSFDHWADQRAVQTAARCWQSRNHSAVANARQLLTKETHGAGISRGRRGRGLEPAALRLSCLGAVAPRSRPSQPALGPDDVADGLDVWSGRRGSNPQLQPWEGCTLPLSYSRAGQGDEDSAGRGQGARPGAAGEPAPPLSGKRPGASAA
jgi:hypothetical protein